MREPVGGLRRGKLKIFLGYAAGVGKTYQMLEEAQELKRQGVDVVIGYFEPHGRKDTIAKAEGLPQVPRRVIEYRGSRFEEMDTGSILARKPRVAIVDEFPHTNVPGSQRVKRWEDVEALLDNGIDVLTTMNVQHLESLNDQIWHITGIRVRETIPDWVVKQADEVIMIDVTPRALLNRLERGVVYAPDKAQRAMDNFFREDTLNALRELALRQTAHEVNNRQFGREGAEMAEGSELLNNSARALERSERILVYVTDDPSTAALIRRGRRVADYLHAECFAVAIHPGDDLNRLPPDKREKIEKHLNFARNLHLETRVLSGANIAAALVEFARQNQITQIFLTRSARRSWTDWFSPSVLQQVVREASDMRVVIVADRRRQPRSRS
jgi:two-component system sensor histidine kinase KdpD